MNEFSVIWYDPEGTAHKERESLSAADAVRLAHSLSLRPAAKPPLSVIRKIMIVDGEDFCVFLWEDGKIRYPTPETIELHEQLYGSH
jgi:hypothetical protein